MVIVIKIHTLGVLSCPLPEIGYQFHDSWNFLQSSLIIWRNKKWRSHRWWLLLRSKEWWCSSLRKNALQLLTNCVPTSTHNHSIRVLRVEEPHIKLALFAPQIKIIRIETSLFSPPLSPRIRYGIPYSHSASRNISRTVEALLSILAFNPVI